MGNKAGILINFPFLSSRAMEQSNRCGKLLQPHSTSCGKLDVPWTHLGHAPDPALLILVCFLPGRAWEAGGILFSLRITLLNLEIGWVVLFCFVFPEEISNNWVTLQISPLLEFQKTLKADFSWLPLNNLNRTKSFLLPRHFFIYKDVPTLGRSA